MRDDVDASLNENGIFTTNEVNVLHRVEAENSGTSIFLKEGSPPNWLFRAEIMYKRDPDSASKLSKEQLEARMYLRLAGQAEEDGDIMDAINLYKKAYRLDPSLEETQM